jgi:hypothetical protein
VVGDKLVNNKRKKKELLIFRRDNPVGVNKPQAHIMNH